MRAILLILVLAILVVIGLVFTGVISLQQIQPAQAPKFNLKVNDVNVGTTTTNVQVPAVEMKTKQVEVPKLSVTDHDSQANAQ
jgi:cytochrome oxidase Cu insertion factor (SCO1/SenC/PrrC family)